MYHFYDLVVNDATGVPIPGINVRVYDAETGAPADIFADENGTPIVTVSGVANAAVTDDGGNYDFFIADGNYTVRLYSGSALVKSIRNIQMKNAASVADVKGKAQAAALGVSGDASNMGTTPGTILSDNGTAKQWFEESEAAIEARPTSATLAAGTGSTLGYNRSVTGSVLRTQKSKNDDIINVRDFGTLVGDGVTDNYPAFKAAFDAAPWGGSIYVPQTGLGGYYLSASPIGSSTKPVNWIFDTGIQFSGPGLGDPNTGNGTKTFLSLYTNPWLRVIGQQRNIQFGTINSPSGGAVVGDSWEWRPDSLAGWPLTFTGDLTNGSAVITNVPAAVTAAAYKGCRITSDVAQWGYDGSTTRNLRVFAVDKVNNTITVGYDIYNNNTFEQAPYLGASASGVTFVVHKRQWFAGRYEGLNTSTADASITGEVHYEICNPVMNIHGAPGAMYEFNLNIYAAPNEYSRVLFITGGGDTPYNRLLGIDMQRGGSVAYATALSIRNARVGVFANAKYPIQIDTTYNNNETGGTETIGYGVHFNNASALFGSLFEGRQLTNGSSAITIQRNTDTNPTGKAFNLRDAANTNDMAFIEASGALVTYAPANSRGSTTSSGSIECNGLTIRGGCNLRLGVDAQPATKAATGKYLEIVQSDGTSVYIPTYE